MSLLLQTNNVVPNQECGGPNNIEVKQFKLIDEVRAGINGPSFADDGWQLDGYPNQDLYDNQLAESLDRCPLLLSLSINNQVSNNHTWWFYNTDMDLGQHFSLCYYSDSLWCITIDNNVQASWEDKGFNHRWLLFESSSAFALFISLTFGLFIHS